MEQFEIIDIKPAEELYRTWRPFICREHYGIENTFYSSWIALHPRRSIEAISDAVIQCAPHQERQLPQSANWSELLEWFQPLFENEKSFDK